MSGIIGQYPHLDTDRFLQLSAPLVDVRSSVEFNRGHIPRACNLPLFDDDQRAEIGITYKKLGHEHAILRGLELIGPRLAPIAKQLQDMAGTGSGVIGLYCWRGGMRSGSVAWLAGLVGLRPSVLQGGYKQYRHWVLRQFSRSWPLYLIGGRTGTGKTDLLHVLASRGVDTLDLEALANHRGSSFGGLGLPAQPTSEHYENRLAEVLDEYRHNGSKAIWLEAESTQIGRCRIPQELFLQMSLASVLEIYRTEEERITRLISIYSNYGGDALLKATQRISRRLGPQRTAQTAKAIERGDWELACQTLLNYYDRCYDRELRLRHAPERMSIDLTGLSDEDAATMLLDMGLIRDALL